MKTLHVAVLCGLSLLLSGCHAKFGKHVELDFGVLPPTNAVVRVTVKKVGIVLGQNPATGAPDVTLGYASVTYDRVPLNGTNVPQVSAAITTTQSGFNTTISETFSTGDQPLIRTNP